VWVSQKTKVIAYIKHTIKKEKENTKKPQNNNKKVSINKVRLVRKHII